MKKLIGLCFLITLIVSFHLQAQDSVSLNKDKSVLYTIGYNRVPDGVNIPLIGFINLAKGNHRGLQLGFANTTANNFNGLAIGFANTVGNNNQSGQIGFFNTVGNNSDGLTVGFFNTAGNKGKGIQMGFFNTFGDSFKGIQTGFFNTLGDAGSGVQVGFFNTLGNSYKGLQVGFFNTLGNKVEGVQFGFSNILGNSTEGLQVGFSNIVGNKTSGLQVGFFNRTRNLAGVEIGFLNLVDTVEKGLPIGFLSFVKKGGYQALEVGASEMFPFNISYKTGIRQFYTSIIASYNPVNHNHYAIGMGIGSLIPLNKKIDFNPELVSQTTCTVLWDQIYSLNLNLKYEFSHHFSLAAGPTLVWNHLNNGTIFHQSWFSLYQKELDPTNKLLIGMKLALSYQFGN